MSFIQMKNTAIAVLLGIALWAESGVSFSAETSQLATKGRSSNDGQTRGDQAIDASELANKSKINTDAPSHVDEGSGDRDYSADVNRCGAIAGTDKVLCIVPANRNRDQM